MISREQIELNVCRGYIRHVQETFPQGAYYAYRYLLILQIREWQIKRHLRNIPLTLDQMPTLKHGIREAERFLHEIDGGEPRWVPEETAEILCAVILELTKEVVHTEERYPDLNFAFTSAHSPSQHHSMTRRRCSGRHIERSHAGVQECLPCARHRFDGLHTMQAQTPADQS